MRPLRVPAVSKRRPQPKGAGAYPFAGALLWHRPHPAFHPGRRAHPGEPLPKAGTAESIPEVRFEFPEVLRDAEVLVPYVEEYLDGEAKPEDVGEYLLQAGAFRSSEDADRRRAMILLQDLPARTVAVRRDGGTWHRVLVGPFESRRAARAAQLALLREDIDSLVLRSEP